MDSIIPGNLLTTAMAVIPHTVVVPALEKALSLDVPFWPQLSTYSYCEDMYVQAAEHFPGIVLNLEKRMLRFSMNKFAEAIETALNGFEDPAMFVDEPGLQFLFSAMAGYSDLKAKGDLDQYFAHVDRPRGIHLCGNPDWDFLLNLDLDVLSL